MGIWGSKWEPAGDLQDVLWMDLLENKASRIEKGKQTRNRISPGSILSWSRNLPAADFVVTWVTRALCSFWSLLELAPGLCDQEKSHANHWKGREEADFEIPFPFSPKTFRVLCRVTNPISHQGFFCSFLHFLKQQNKQQARIDGMPFKRLSGVRVEKQRIEEQIAIIIRIILLLLLVF